MVNILASLALVGIVALLVTQIVASYGKYCKKQDCRSAEEKLNQAKTDAEARKICDSEFADKSQSNAPTKCLEIYKLK